MEDGAGGENEDDAAYRRAREAQEKIDQPKVDALKAELIALRGRLDPEGVFGKESFLRQFKCALERAERFVEVIYPKPLP